MSKKNTGGKVENSTSQLSSLLLKERINKVVRNPSKDASAVSVSNEETDKSRKVDISTFTPKAKHTVASTENNNRNYLEEGVDPHKRYKNFLKGKHKEQVSTLLEENRTMPARDARLLRKKEFKLAKTSRKYSKLAYKFTRKDGDRSFLVKKNKIEEKAAHKVAKKVYKVSKKSDPTMVRNVVKREAKIRIKHKAMTKPLDILRQDDSLREGIEGVQTALRYKRNTQTLVRVGKLSARAGFNIGRVGYSVSNRFFNLARGRGFQKTPVDLRLRTKAINRWLNFKNRLDAYNKKKKSELGVNLVKQLFKGEKTLGEAGGVLAKNPYVWIALGVIALIVPLLTLGQFKPPTTQDEFELTDSWTLMTKLDAENTDTSNTFFTPLDDVMLYMNERFDDYKLSDTVIPGADSNNYGGSSGGTYQPERISDYMKSLWSDLNGKKPDFKITSMEKLITDEESKYYLTPDNYEQFREALDEAGAYVGLDGQLDFPFQTDSLVVTRRFGYERNGENINLYPSIKITVTPGQEINSPITTGVVNSIIDTSSITITTQKEGRITIKGVDSSRFVGGETITSGTYLGNARGTSLEVTYERPQLDDKDVERYVKVNPAFYFPKVIYTQFSSLASDNFSPNADMANRATKVKDYYLAKGYSLEGICAALGNWSVESSINPKRTEGDYLSPPVGASGNSWDDENWLNMNGMDIYGNNTLITKRGLGLGQWTDTADGGQRHTFLVNYAKSQNKKWYDLELQLDFALNGDAPGSKTMFTNVLGAKVSGTIPELTHYFLVYWEGNSGDKLQERVQAAQDWYNYFTKSSTDLTGSSQEVFDKYKDKMKPLPTDKEMKEGYSGNAYALGNCTWYVYNRMKQLGKTIAPYMGNANQWTTNYSQTSGASLVSDPARGDIIIFTNGAANSNPTYGHVAIIEHVNSDGTFVISEMNTQGVYSMGYRVLSKVPGEYFMRVK